MMGQGADTMRINLLLALAALLTVARAHTQISLDELLPHIAGRLTGDDIASVVTAP